MALFSGIAGLASMAGSWTLFGSTALFSLAKTAVGIGLNMLAARLSGRKASAPAFSVKGQLQRGADLPQSFLIGRCATAGSLTYANTWGQAGKTPNGWLTMVITLSDLPVQSLDGLWVDGKECTFGPAHADYGLSVAEFNASGTDHLWVKFYDGSQTVADPHLVNTVSSTERPWDADAVGYGTAYAIVTARINQELFQGFPECLFELTGAKLYDPSKDTSVGGDGPQRWDIPATWGGDGDHLPAVQLYNLFRGISADGNWFYGMQATHAAQMPVAHWINQIEKCRAPIASADGQEPTYRAGGEIAVGAPIAEAMEALLTSCGGRISEAGGLYKLFVGGADAPVLSLTDDDILSSEEQTFSPFFGLADTINGVSGKFPDPAQVWQIESAPPLNNSDLEVEDGGRRLMVDVLFDLVPYSEQVQRLMRGGLNEARRARRHTFVLPPRFWTLEPGDIVSFSSERNGYDAKLFRLDGALDQSNADLLADLTEVDPADYDFDTNTDYTPVTGGSVISPVIPPQPIAGWFALPSSAPDAQNQNRIPAIAVGWDGAMDDVVAVLVRVRVKSSGAVIFSGRFDDVATGSGLLTSGLVGGVTYEVQGRYVPGSARETVWSDWIEVTTLDLRLSLNELAPSVSQVISDAQAAADQAAFEAAAAEASANQALTDLDELTVGFTGSLSSAFAARDTAIGGVQGAVDAQLVALSAEIDQANVVAALEGVSVLAEPAANWSHRVPTADPVLIKDPVSSGTFITADPDLGHCYEFPDGANRTIGQAAGFEYVHGRIYEITYRFKVVNNGASGNGVQPRFGITTQRGEMVLEINQQAIPGTVYSVADGVQELTIQFSSNPDHATGADYYFSIGAASASANRIYPHFRQYHEAVHDGIARVASIIVRDITAARAVDASVRATLTQDYYTAAQADSAVALSQQTVQANLDALSAQLSSDYLTAVETDAAIASAQTALQAEIDAVDARALDAIPGDFREDGRFYGSENGGTPSDQNPLTSAFTFHDDPDEGRFARVSDLTIVRNDNMWTRGYVRAVPGRTYRFTVRARYTGAPTGQPRFNMLFVALDENLAWKANLNNSPRIFTDQWADYTIERTWQESDGPFFRLRAYRRSDLTGTGTVDFSRFTFEDVTDVKTVAADLASNYLTTVETDAAIAAAKTELNAEISSVSDAQSGFQVVLDNVDAGVAHADVTVTLGGATLGQSGHLVVTDVAGVSPSTWGTTNGYYLTIPTAQALQFAKRRARIAVMARSASVNGAVRFEVAYSTSDNGNSGVMVSGSLTDSWAWYVFYYDVPTALAGGSDFLGLYGDADRQGRATEFARVVIDIAPDAEDLPEIASMQGQITDIQGLELGALSGTAFGTMLEELSVAADGTIAGVSAFGTAMATLYGDAQSSYRIEAVAGGSVGEVRVVAGNDGSEVLLRGDNIVAEGTLNVDRISVGLGVNMLENSDFAQGLLHTRRGGIGQVAASASLYLIPAGQLWATASTPSIVLKSTVDTNNDGFAELFFQPNLADGLSYSQGYAVEPLQFYEFAIQATFHRVRWKLNINFHDGLGNYISTAVLAQGDAGDGVTGGTDDAPLSWTRVGGACAAPATAVFARPVVQLLATKSAIDGMIIAHRPVFASVGSLNAPLSPYRPGTNTLITGERVVTPNLSAISANIGHFKSAASGERVEILDDRILVYDAANQIRVKIGDLS